MAKHDKDLKKGNSNCILILGNENRRFWGWHSSSNQQNGKFFLKVPEFSAFGWSISIIPLTLANQERVGQRSELAQVLIGHLIGTQLNYTLCLLRETAAHICETAIRIVRTRSGQSSYCV